MPYATDDEAREFFAGEDAGDLAVEVVMGASADAVQRWAAAPATLPEPDDYTGRAKRAELLLGRYLWQTKGFVSSKGLGPLSTSFDVEGKAVRQIVSDAMGDYFSARKIRIFKVERA